MDLKDDAGSKSSGITPEMIEAEYAKEWREAMKRHETEGCTAERLT